MGYTLYLIKLFIANIKWEFIYLLLNGISYIYYKMGFHIFMID